MNVEMFLKSAWNEGKEANDTYGQWSEAYETLYAQVTAEQKRQLEKLYGCFNDLAEDENFQTYIRGLHDGVTLMVMCEPIFEQRLNALMKIIENN